MNTPYWMVIRDDTKKTFEVIGKETNTNHFDNSIHGMQRVGMNVTGLTPPVTNKNSSKGSITFAGYTVENGLHERLMKEFLKRTRAEFES